MIEANEKTLMTAMATPHSVLFLLALILSKSIEGLYNIKAKTLRDVLLQVTIHSIYWKNNISVYYTKKYFRRVTKCL